MRELSRYQSVNENNLMLSVKLWIMYYKECDVDQLNKFNSIEFYQVKHQIPNKLFRKGKVIVEDMNMNRINKLYKEVCNDVK